MDLRLALARLCWAARVVEGGSVSVTRIGGRFPGPMLRRGTFIHTRGGEDNDVRDRRGAAELA